MAAADSCKSVPWAKIGRILILIACILSAIFAILALISGQIVMAILALVVLLFYFSLEIPLEFIHKYLTFFDHLGYRGILYIVLSIFSFLTPGVGWIGGACFIIGSICYLIAGFVTHEGPSTVSPV